MNKSLALVTLLAALTAAAPVLARGGSQVTYAAAIPVSAVTRDGAKVVSVGSSEAMVREELGAPFATYANNVWVFPNYHANQPVDDKLGCTTLVISFENYRVASIALVNPKAAKVLASKCRSDSAFMTRQILALK